MKNLKLISTIIGLSLCNISCEKDADPQPESIPCATLCYNGGIITSDCGCDCPQGFTGPNCLTVLASSPTFINIHVPINNSYAYYMPPARYAGDNEFGGKSSMNWNVELVISQSKTQIHAIVNAGFIEINGDTKAKIDGNLNSNKILLYTAPAGKKVHSINSSYFVVGNYTPPQNQYILFTYYHNSFVYKVEILGDTSGQDLPADGTTGRSRFRIWFDDFNITITDI